MLDVLESAGFLAEVDRKAKFLRRELSDLPAGIVTEVRGLGLLIGIQLNGRARPCLQALASRGVLALPAGPKVLRLLPPIIASTAELKEVVAALRDVLCAV